MSNVDRKPLQDTPATSEIARSHNNRLGAVYSSLSAFWNARQGSDRGPRRDAYSVVLFDNHIHHATSHDTVSNPEELLANVLRYRPGFGTNFGRALEGAHRRMTDQWDHERSVGLTFFLFCILIRNL